MSKEEVAGMSGLIDAVLSSRLSREPHTSHGCNLSFPVATLNSENKIGEIRFKCYSPRVSKMLPFQQVTNRKIPSEPFYHLYTHRASPFASAMCQGSAGAMAGGLHWTESSRATSLGGRRECQRGWRSEPSRERVAGNVGSTSG